MASFRVWVALVEMERLLDMGKTKRKCLVRPALPVVMLCMLIARQW
jgi:hypothetical protein